MNKPLLYSLIFTGLVAMTGQAYSANESIHSFSKAKRLLQQQVYHDHRITLYCGAPFGADKRVVTPSGFATSKHKKRAKKIEWEHVVPAENFGRAFSAWREGDPACVDRKGKAFKGRKCAEKTSLVYRYMQADLFNLFPAIGAVNARRSNYNFVMLPEASSSFGSCPMKIQSKKVEPPEAARGRVARTYLYMDASYPNYSMSKQQRQLMNAWDKQYPVEAWECERNARITRLQQSHNAVMEARCTR